MSGNFNDDLKLGGLVEDIVADRLEKYFDCTIYKPNHLEYDLYCPHATIEVKFDKRWQETGNVAIEYEYCEEPSGIAKSKATHWAYMLGEDIFICKTMELRAELQTLKYKTVRGGDGNMSKMLLMPLKDFKNLFTKI